MSSRSWVKGLLLLGVVLAVLALRTHRERQPQAASAPAPPPTQGTPTLARGAEPEGMLGVILPESAVDIVSRLTGRLGSVQVQVGEKVKQGTVLATLDLETLHKDLAIATAETQSALADQEVAALALAEAQERLARREDPNQLRLGALSEEELNTARYEQRLALAKLQAAKSRVAERQARAARLQQDIESGQLRAPFDGVVAGRNLDAGAHVTPGQVILHLLRSGAPRVRFAVPERRWREVVVGGKVRVRLAEEELMLPAQIINVAPEVDAAARVIFALAEFDAPALERPLPSGTVVRVFMEPASTAKRPEP